MITATKKLIGSLLGKILIIIIILPFLFWGMGDVFRGGNQNILVKIDNQNISTQEFLNSLNRRNIDRTQIKNDKIFNDLLSELITSKIVSLEIENFGIKISPNALKNLILNDKQFKDNDQFSRTSYEKFLIESGLQAATFEKIIAEQEKKRQLLDNLSEGLVVPDFLVQTEYRKENQTKELEFIDLNEIYNKFVLTENDRKELFEKNKDLFLEEYKTINYAELSPVKITSKNEYDEVFFKKIEEIENKLFDTNQITQIVKDFNLDLKKLTQVNASKKDVQGNQIDLDDQIFKNMFNFKENEPGVTKIGDKYYLIQINNVEKINKNLNDKAVAAAIDRQLKLKNILEVNSEIIGKFSNDRFNAKKYTEYAVDKNVRIQNTIIKNLKDNQYFSDDMIRRVFSFKNNEINLITNNDFSKSYLVKINNTVFNNLSENSDKYDEFKVKALISLSQEIYKSYDLGVNKKYDIEINDKVIQRFKNSL